MILNTFQKTLFMKAVLDTTMHDCYINASLLLKCNQDEEKCSTTVGNSSDQTDVGITKVFQNSLYKLISDSNVEVSFA